jgi:hypothetical protein
MTEIERLTQHLAEINSARLGILPVTPPTESITLSRDELDAIIAKAIAGALAPKVHTMEEALAVLLSVEDRTTLCTPEVITKLPNFFLSEVGKPIFHLLFKSFKESL